MHRLLEELPSLAQDEEPVFLDFSHKLSDLFATFAHWAVSETRVTCSSSSSRRTDRSGLPAINQLKGFASGVMQASREAVRALHCSEATVVRCINLVLVVLEGAGAAAEQLQQQQQQLTNNTLQAVMLHGRMAAKYCLITVISQAKQIEKFGRLVSSVRRAPAAGRNDGH
jgi:hypothetical protein